MDISATATIKKLLVLFLVIAGLYFAKTFLMPLAIGSVLGALFLPLAKWLEARRIPPLLAVFICFFVLLLVMGSLGYVLVWQVRELASEAATIRQRGLVMLADLQQYLFRQFGISLDQQSRLFNEQKPFFSQLIKGTAGAVTSLASSSLLILIYMILLLFYRRHIGQFLLRLAPPDQKAEMRMVVTSVARVSQQYLLGLSKMIVCLWIMYGVGFSALGVQHALFFAVLCGILEIVPFIGNITGTTITVLVAAVQGGSPTMLAGIVVVYGVVQFVQGWVLEPLIVGRQVRINPLFTIVALVAGNLIWGIPGIFLAIPLTAMFKIVCDNIESLKPYGFLIGETVAPQKGKSLFTRFVR